MTKWSIRSMTDMISILLTAVLRGLAMAKACLRKQKYLGRSLLFWPSRLFWHDDNVILQDCTFIAKTGLLSGMTTRSKSPTAFFMASKLSANANMSVSLTVTSFHLNFFGAIRMFS